MADYEAFSEVYNGVTLRGGVDVLAQDQIAATLQGLNPAVVVNCVGLVKQLKEADDPYLGVAINSLVPHHLARVCSEIGARLIHVSTDCVFDGRRGRYCESDPADASDFYGRTKALGETLPSETSAVTLRTSFIGRELKSQAHGLVEWFLTRDGQSVDGFENVIYSGLTSIELARVVQRVVDLDEGLSGVYQVASKPVSKYDLLVLIRKAFGLDIEIRRASRPVSDRSLVMESFAAVTGYEAPSWKSMIEEMEMDPTPYEHWKASEADQ